MRVRGMTTWMTVALASACLIGTAGAQEEPKSDPEELEVDDGAFVGPAPSEQGLRFEEFVAGRTERARAAPASEATRRALDLALAWLKQHQGPKGGWSATAFDAQCRLNKCGDPATDMSDAGVTGAALCAFLAAGQTHRTEPYAETVRSGLKRLKEWQTAEGCYSAPDSKLRVYDHLWGALAMTEAYAMTGSRRWKASATRAVSFVLAAQNPYLAWGNGVRRGKNDTGHTVLAMAVLRSAQSCDLFERDDANGMAKWEVKGAIAWIDKMTDPKSGGIGNERRGGVNDPKGFPRLSTLGPTAAGLLTRMYAGQDLSRAVAFDEGLNLLRLGAPTEPNERVLPDYEMWFWGGLTAHQAGGKVWTAWRQPLLRVLRTTQVTTEGRDERGSWSAAHPRARHGGRVLATAMNAMSLSVDHRYARLRGDSD